jgi:hypothetical protein
MIDSKLRRWLHADEATASLSCKDAALRTAMVGDLAREARRQGFEVVLVPLGPDLWWLPDVAEYVEQQLDAVGVSMPNALEWRAGDEPLVVVFDGIDDADDAIPWDRWLDAASPQNKVLITASTPLPDAIVAPAQSSEPPPPRDAELVDLLSAAVASLTLRELCALLGRKPEPDDAWVEIDHRGWRLKRALRHRSGSTDWDRTLAAVKGPYARYAVVHLCRVDAGVPELHHQLTLPSARRFVAARGARVRTLALARLVPDDPAVLALAVEAALTQAGAGRYPSDDAHAQCVAHLALADTVDGEPRIELVALAMAAARGCTGRDRADALLRVAERSPPKARTKLIAQACALVADEPPAEQLWLIPHLPSRARDDLLRKALPALTPRQRTEVTASVVVSANDSASIREVLGDACALALELGAGAALLALVPHIERVDVARLVAQRDRLPERVCRALAMRLAALGEPSFEAVEVARTIRDRAQCVVELAVDASRVWAWLEGLGGEDQRTAAAVTAPMLARAGYGADVLRLSSDIGVQRGVAEGDPTLRGTLEPALFDWALQTGQKERLLELVPIAWSWEGDRRLLSHTLQEVATDLRRAALAGEHVSIAAIAPLLARPAGSAGVIAVGRAIAELVSRDPA